MDVETLMPISKPLTMREALAQADPKGNLTVLIEVEEKDFTETSSILEMQNVYSEKVVKEGYLYPMQVLIKDTDWKEGKMLVEVSGYYSIVKL
jgi:hypothetical protein